MTVSRKRTRPDVAVVGRKADVAVGHAGFYDITAVLIDMTGWNNGEHGDADLYDEGIRPYRVDFLDGRKRNQTVYGTWMNSGCLQDVLAAAKSEFRAVVSPSTEIMIICPADCLDESSRRESGQARLCKFKASDLFTMGPEEKDLFLSDGGAARARLDTCLDSLAHAVLVDRQPCYPPMERRRRFPRSVHDFSEEDRGLYFQWADEYARYQKEIQEEYARRHSGRYYEEGGGLMERYYVTSREISGMTKRDRRIAMEQCVERGSFAILDPAQFIATRLFQFLEDYIDTRYTRRWILGKLREGGFFNLTVNNPGVGIRVERVVLGADLEKGVYFGDIRGNASIRRVYEVDVIDDKKLAYLACEYIVHPFDGVPFVERTYTPLFTQLARANRYVQSESKNYECAYGDGDSGWHVIPVDADAIQQSTWYQANLKAASDIKQYHLNREDFRYIQDVEELRKRIQESAYDDLVSSEKDGINHAIYMAVRAYLPDDIREDLDMALDEFGDGFDGDVEGVADQAIRAAYAYAADKDAFDVLTEVLAPWRFRVEGANDYVYNAHPDTGWLLAARNGGIGWYEEAFFANEWEGNRGNPWFGKFIPNACEPLPFVMEFDPNCFVDRLPTQAELDMLRGRYMETVRDRRAEHGEMVFEDCEDDMGENVPCCVGDWYPDGLDVDEETKYKGVFFRVQYGNHTFTEDECRKLLSGEEVSIDGFMTKSKMTVSIRGKLMNRTGQFSKYLDIQYVRTDVHGNTRRAYARKLGLSIDEGLPDDPAAFSGGI